MVTKTRTATEVETFIEHSKPFIEWMLNWKAGLQPLSLATLINQHPEQVGIVSVDVIEGFCHVGPLSSPRVKNIIAPITRLLEEAWAQGIRDIALPQDTHPEDAVEFAQYGVHCVRDTVESQTVAAFKQLPFFENIAVIEKNSINAGVNETFVQWVKARPQIQTWIIVGDCTDICTYQLAMYLRIAANEQQRHGLRVIVPVDAVDTYDLPVQTALEIGATPHNAELLHLVFLYHMMLNGVEVVSEIAP
ncbi:MAG TPA: isochorismatase family protein [Phototrophicaceae bacterium]|nr:isochorismatase family protein [Phototrophicaceae bacterium]